MAVKVYVGKLPLSFCNVSGYVRTPASTLPLGEASVMVGVDITPESFTPTIVPLTVTRPPTRSLARITPSTTAVAISPSIVSVEFVSCPLVTLKSPNV